MNFRLFLTALFATFIAAANAQDNVPALDAEVAPSSLYTGFEQLLDDDQTLVLEDLIDLDQNIRRVALYHNGDRLHRQIPKQVHLMIENKLMHRMMDSERFEVIQCLECRTTQVAMKADKLEISHPAEDNQSLRKLGKQVRADAFMFWNASVHENKFTINLRMVDARDNKLLWIKEYSKKTTLEQETEGFDSVTYEFTVGAWGISAERDNSVTNATEDVKGMTVFGIRRRETTSLDDSIEYTLALEYFKNFSNTDYFDVSGINLEGRIIADIPAMDSLLDTKVYMGIGQSFYNDTNSLVFRFGFEFPFFKDGFVDYGVVYMPEGDARWLDVADYERTGKFGGASYDLTLGLRF
ncbi:MAG: hypothetical protein KBT77_02755 [Thalassolituus oleivorans]|uniref:hypothetical protein n=1 Tax=Thalassolituus oleivorans TaxID=187493 RepID=UPI001B70559E|nr:hypothetical protein [Thalassolituus oleivorans]MBQ0726253.1 hypothetical protein [Thalassolituus oleivorans]MBQ0779702.1 hypothetical protein [Thalassolituus oleivorans]